MTKYTGVETLNALKIIDSLILKCLKIQPKFNKGTSQYTLLKNRIKALEISKCILLKDGSDLKFSLEEMEKALPPIDSIIHKTEKARQKYTLDEQQFKRLTPLIEAMYIAKSNVIDTIEKRK